MKTLSLADYELLKRDATVLSRDEWGGCDKVLRTPHGRIIKLFRRKRLLSSALLWPYALRFQRAARRLKALGVPSIDLEDVFRIPALRRHAVVYRMIEGVDLRAAIAGHPERRDDLLLRLARFLARLHERGVCFRAIHFGNVLVRPDDELALIDVSEARFSHGGLGPSQRARNFKPMVRYQEDAAAIRGLGPARFLRAYLEAAHQSPRDQARFLAAVSRVDPMFQAGDGSTLPMAADS